jgi:hypothetical protein
MDGFPGFGNAHLGMRGIRATTDVPDDMGSG